jgi:DNA-binding winged helix-turn-helix (wHTH) protein
MAAGPKVFYEFGPFRVDPDKQILLRENHPVPITPKAFDTLLILVRHSREVVSKDELMKAVWPEAFVEESNLSQNIFALRKALGDTPEARRYIVTLPGRGYRFTAEVRTVTQEEDLVIQSRSRSQIVVEQTDSSPAAVLRTPAAARKVSWKYALPMAALALLAIAIAVSVLLYSHRVKGLTEKDTLVLADFENKTGDPVSDDTLKQALAMNLGQSPFLNILSDRKVAATLRLMGRSPDQPVTGELARELCQRVGSKAVLAGSISTLGNN